MTGAGCRHAVSAASLAVALGLAVYALQHESPPAAAETAELPAACSSCDARHASRQKLQNSQEQVTE